MVTSWNAGAERIFGYAAGEMIGRSITLLIPPDRQDDEEQIQAQIRRGESAEHFETVRMRKDGSLVDVSVTVSPIKDAPARSPAPRKWRATLPSASGRRWRCGKAKRGCGWCCKRRRSAIGNSTR
jgi:PAS domain-containing protein